MEPTIITPRLSLSLLQEVERGQPEFGWLHELHSNEKTTWWSILGQSKSYEDTERAIQRYLPSAADSASPQYKVVYAVHRFPPSTELSAANIYESSSQQREHAVSQFIGLVTLGPGGLVLPGHLTLSASAAQTTLTIEVAYHFLPSGWGAGYATESVNAVFDACRRAKEFWSPYKNLYVRAIVNPGNPASMRVMDKVGMKLKGTFDWSGKAVYLAGKWRDNDTIQIYGQHLLP